ncbi:MAG: hypothetical protein R3F59_29510 [Myxococcota bacterium]
MVWWLAAAAWGGDIYVNGTQVEPRSMAGVSLSGATVRFDDQGNVLVSAPGYKIQVAGEAPAPRPPVIGPSTAPAPAPVAPTPRSVPYGRYWVVTEDQGSKGHLVEVYVNGTLAASIRSGQGTQLLELSKWLHPGNNDVLMKSTSTDAGGGPLTVFAGVGGTEKGHFDMPSPQIEYGLGPGKRGSYERKYTLTAAADPNAQR